MYLFIFIYHLFICTFVLFIIFNLFIKMQASLESKAIGVLETYEGFNNYILELKRKSQLNKKF